MNAKSPKKTTDGFITARDDDDANNPLVQQLMKKAKNLEQVKKGRGRLYKTPNDRQGANKTSANNSVIHENLAKAPSLTSKRIALKDKKPIEKQKYSDNKILHGAAQNPATSSLANIQKKDIVDKVST